MRGRGGARGGARGVGQKRGPKQKRRQIIMEEEPEEEDVIAYMNMREMGVWEPAKTGLDTAELERFVPDMGAMAYAPSQEEAIRGHFRSITGQVANEKTEGTWHSQRYLQGEGTLFVDSAERKSVTKDRHYDWTPSRYAHLPKAVQELMIKQLVGGEYTKLEEVKKGDTVKTVQVNTLRNETYLSTDTIKITEKVQKMVPIPKPAAKKPVGKPAKK